MHERYRQTDRQTDRQTTDGRATAYSEREREFTFAKNVETVNDLVLSQEDKPQTHRTVREIITENGYSSVVYVPDYL